MKGPALFLLPVSIALAETAEQGAASQLTLDPGLYAEALREVHGLPQPPAADAGSSAAVRSLFPGVEDWQAAMRDAGTELADVRLLVLLQRLNPQAPPSARAEDYAAVLHLHHLMLAGNPRACLALARACREGQFESGLQFIQSEPLAVMLERRASVFQLPLLPAAPAAESACPEDAAGTK